MTDTYLNGEGRMSDDSTVPNGAEPTSPKVAAPASSSAPTNDLDDVLYSDIGLTTLLDRLKQSIASARDFAAFLKKRASIEEDHAKDLKRLAKTTQDGLHRGDSRQGTYARQVDEAMRMHERMFDNGMQFALSLHQMHEDLIELSTNMERGRKHWKHEGLDAEKKASDAESMMQRAKAKYDSLAEDYDRAKTGDIKGSRRIMKGPKSAAQHEEDLLRKLQASDSDYSNKVQEAKLQRQKLINASRPQAVKSLQALINECDSALSLQLQKFATFNEKLLLGNGMLITPLPSESSNPHSLRDIMNGVDNERDLHSHLASHRSKVPPKPAEIQYHQHPTLLSKQQAPTPASRQASSTYPQQATPSLGSGPAPPPHQNGPTPGQAMGGGPSPGPTPDQAMARAPTSPQSHQPPYQSSEQGPPQLSQNAPFPDDPRNAYSSPPPPQAQNPPYPTGNMGARMPSGQSTQMPTRGPPPTQAAAPSNLPPPVRPVFGVDLEELFQRDGSAVPMVVYQCMQAVDLFGLDVEGIYRLSGTAAHVQQLKALFDHDASRVDFRNPAAFHHDVNSVAGLLKQFFRDLPDPLITRERYSELINAARIEDDVGRRDTVHAIVNGLPDANYATLRALVLHLHRVQEHYATNRMSTSNLAICFAPSVMGSHHGPHIGDAGLQAKVVDTILTNTYQIFDED